LLNAILELINDALLWKLDEPVYIGLSNTSLADQHGNQILAFLKSLPKFSLRQPAVQLDVHGVLSHIFSLNTCMLQLKKRLTMCYCICRCLLIVS
jgi:hypothetical protein